MPAESLIIGYHVLQAFLWLTGTQTRKGKTNMQETKTLAVTLMKMICSDYRCNGVDIEILCMLQKLCGYHQIFLACIIYKLKCKPCMTFVMRDVVYYDFDCR